MAGAKSKYTLTAQDQTKRALKSAIGNFEEASKKVQKYGARAATAAQAGIGLLVVRQSRMIDRLDKSAAKLGVTTQALSEYRYAAELSAGMTGEQFDVALQRMTRRLAEAAEGTGEAKNAIKELGLDAARLSEMAPTAAFREVAGAMQSVENQSDRVRLAFKLFDSEGVDLVNTLSLGKDGLDQMAQEARALEQSISGVDADRIVRANDALTRAGKVASGFGNAIAVAVAPAVEDLANRFLAAAKESGGMGEMATRAVNAVIKAIGYVGNAMRGWQMLWVSLKLYANEFYGFAVTVIGEIASRIESLVNKIPWINIEFSKTIKAIGAGMQARADEAREQLAKLAAEPLPLEKVEAWYANTQARAEEHSKRMQWIKADRIAKEIILEIQGNKKKQQLRDKESRDQLKTDKRTFKAAIQQASSSSKAIFQIQKAQQIAEGVLGLKSTILSSYRFGASIGGPPLGAAFAAIGGAAQAVNLAAIKATGFSGGGGGGASGGGGSVPSVSSMVEREQERNESTSNGSGQRPAIPSVTLSIEEDGLYSGRAVRRLFERFRDAIESGEVESLPA